MIQGCSMNGDSGWFEFVVFSDTHVRLPGNPDDIGGRNRRNLDNLGALIDTINGRHPQAEFALVTGDLVGCLFSDEPADYVPGGEENPAGTFKSMMDRLAMPWYAALGNHDYMKDYDPALGEEVPGDPAGVEAVWREVLGTEPYYSFVCSGVRFIVLDSVRGATNGAPCPGSVQATYCTGRFDPEQMAWLRGELRKGEQCFLFLHHLLITDNGQLTWSGFGSQFQVARDDEFYAVVEEQRDKIAAIFVGHGHIWQSDTLFGCIEVHETRATGDTLGGPDNYHLVKVKAGGGEFRVFRSRDF